MIAQAIVDGLLSGAIVALGAIGVTFSLSILRFANFSHGDLLGVGAYAALFLLAMVAGPNIAGGALAEPLGPFSFGWGLPLALSFAMLVAVLISLLLDLLVYRRLRRRGADPLTLVFASFGLALVLRNGVLLLFGPDPHNYSTEIQMAVRLPGPVLVMPDQILVFGITLAVLAVLWFFLQRTRYGMAMRSVAENPVLSGIAGIDIAATVRMTWVVSSMLAALAGVFYGVTVQLRPEMGLNLLLPLFTAAILGGVGSVSGAVLGALLISLAENLVALVIPSTYKPLVPFALLLLVLYFRPAGLFAPKGDTDMLSYLIFFVTVAAILSIATLGLNLQWGVSGQFNAGVVGFLAVGGYSFAILTMPVSQDLLVRLNAPFAVGILGALLVSGIVALAVGMATLRLRSDYLAIATFGIASSIQVLANNLEPLTGGSRGLVGIPRPFESLGAKGFGYGYLLIVLCVVAVVYVALQALLRSPWGRVQRALREDEVACAALGKNVVRFRLTAFVMGAMLMGLSGALYAGFVGTTSPSEFLPILTFQIWAMLIVGGSGSNAGAIAGSFVIWGLWTLSGAVIVSVLPPQWQAQGGALQSILVGLVLVLTLLFRPQGLFRARRAA